MNVKCSGERVARPLTAPSTCQPRCNEQIKMYQTRMGPGLPMPLAIDPGDFAHQTSTSNFFAMIPYNPLESSQPRCASLDFYLWDDPVRWRSHISGPAMAAKRLPLDPTEAHSIQAPGFGGLCIRFRNVPTTSVPRMQENNKMPSTKTPEN